VLRRRTLVIAAVALALLAAAVLGGRAWLLRDTTEPIDVEQVVERAAGEDGARVYAYATRGFERATVLGTIRHDYPETTTITVAQQACGVSARWEALDRRSETWWICDGAPVRFDDVHSFFGRTDERTYRCRGSRLAFTCRREGTTRTDRGRDLGRERVEVDGTAVEARHLRYRTTMRGATRGGGTTDLWLAVDDGLPLRIVVANDSESDTPIGTDADYRERFELRLRSLEPL
jgi:hypothetical protein